MYFSILISSDTAPAFLPLVWVPSKRHHSGSLLRILRWCLSLWNLPRLLSFTCHENKVPLSFSCSFQSKLLCFLINNC
jgi:hypothetical protein